MIGRQKRLHEVYEHLRKYQDIHTQTDLAESLGYSRVYISSAMNGNEKNLTDKLFRNICERFADVFNLDYLLTGEGELLTIQEEVHNEELEKLSRAQQTVDMMELYAQRVRLVDDLRQTLKEELEEVRTIRAELLQARNDFRDATYRLTQALRTLSPNSTLDLAADEK